VDANGLVSPADIEAAIRPNTVLISVMAVNNEVGTVQPIREIAALAARHGVLFHTDAAQAVGRIPIDVQRDGIDLLSMSSHKMYGPKGVGALYISGSPRRTAVAVQMHGGSQERGRRSGTLNVPGIVGFGEAARLARLERDSEMARLRAWRDRLLAVLRRGVPKLRVFGSMEHRVACNLNVAFDDIAGDTFLGGVPEIALSGGAACASGKAGASHMLGAMGFSQRDANCAVRIALGRMTTEREVDIAGQKLVAAAQRLRGQSAIVRGQL
jgi:cysteine desulfurase